MLGTGKNRYECQPLEHVRTTNEMDQRLEQFRGIILAHPRLDDLCKRERGGKSGFTADLHDGFEPP